MNNLVKTPDNVTRVANFVHDLCFEKLEQQVTDQTLRIVRDTIGVMLAGATLPEIKGMAELAPTLAGSGRATLIGSLQTVSPHYAALVNGAGAVSLELDEGNQYAINHPAVHIFPAVFALAEDQQATGAEMLAAFVAGYEVAVRVGRATHLRQAVHPFGTHAIIGTAAAAAKLLGLNVQEIARTLELAAGMTIASSQTAANSGASVRNLVTGLTNHNGLLAPRLVRAGITGEPGALEVIFGRVLGDSFSGDALADDLGRDFYLARNYFKLHACSRWNHAPIEATASLLARTPFQAEDVDEIIVWTYDPATRLSWNEPTNGYAAKHSIPYNVAVRVVRGNNDLEAYSDDAVQDPQIHELSRRVTVLEDPALTSMLPEVRPARVEVKLHSGATLVKTIERPRGGFDNPLTETELIAKFRRLAGLVLSDESVVEIEKLLPKLPELTNLSSFSRLLQAAK